MASDVSLAGAVADACFLAAEGIETVVAHEEGVKDVDAAGASSTGRGRHSRSRAPPQGETTFWSGRSVER